MARVKTGAESLRDKGFASISGLKVGLVTNPTSILPDRSSIIDVLRKAPNVKLLALFGPEHGVRGDVPAGDYIATYTDKRTNVPVYSLYGATKVPTAAMLKGIDVLLFDIQDIGARSYTYLSTLGSVMEGAAAQKVPVMVLDRPNPVGLNRVEGGPTRSGFTSFIGKYPMSYLHGLTLGECGKMINGMGWLPGGRKCELTVVPCENLHRYMATWEAFGGLPWIRTSPNVPRPTSPHFYAATGIMGELSVMSIGIGTEMQFELAGAPGLSTEKFVEELNRRSLPGVTFQPTTWTPAKGVYSGKRCSGVHVTFSDASTASLTRLNFELMDALRVLSPSRSFFSGGTRMYDLSCGTDRVRKAFVGGASSVEVWSIFNEGREGFLTQRKPYLIYPDSL